MRLLVLLLLSVLAIAAPAAAQTAAPPLSAYAADADVTSYVVSPDGPRVAYLQRTGADQRLIVEQNNQPIYAGNLGAAEVAWIQWFSPDHVIVVTRTAAEIQAAGLPQQTFNQATAVDVSRRRSTPLLRRQPGVLRAMSGAPWPALIDERPHAIMPGYDIGNQRFPLYAVPLDGSWPRVLHGGDFNTRGYATDGAGRLTARVLFDDPADRWRLQARRDGGWSTILERTTGDPPRLAGVGLRPGTAILVGALDGGPDVLEVDLQTGATTSLSPPGRRATSAWFNPLTNQLLGVTLSGGDRQAYRFFDATLQGRWDRIVRAFPTDDVYLRSISGDLAQATIFVDGPVRTGDHYHLVDLARGRVEPLADPRPALAAALGEVRRFEYRAADGLALDGVLTLPPRRAASGLPLVVIANSSPEGWSRPGFDYIAQALASRGYAVLRANVRGSARTPELFAAGAGQMGRGMQTDLNDAASALAAAGVVDLSRACVLGSSYGGYAALAAVTVQQGPYRCAASIDGFSDLPALLRVDSMQRGPAGARAARFNRLLGSPAGDFPRDAAALSPLTHARRASAPILLVHGEVNGVVPVEHGRTMRDALQGAGRTVDYVEIADADNATGTPANRLQTLEALVAFVQRHNPPAP